MKKLFAVGLTGLLLTGVMAFAEIPTPSDAVMLTVSGTIALRNADDEFHFDMEMLKALPYTEYEVDDPWIRGVHEYRGVELKTILEYLGYPADASRVVMVAVDDMQAPVKIEHALEFPIMIAYAIGGEEISSRRGGPLKLVFPYHIEGVMEIYPSEVWAWYVIHVRVEL